MKKPIILLLLSLSLAQSGDSVAAITGNQSVDVDQNIQSSVISPEVFDLFIKTYNESILAAKTEPLAIDTPLNRESLELSRARENFRKVAAEQNIPKDTANTLIRLINFNIIGNYLSGWFSEKVAYQLLLEQSSHTNLSLADFFKLSVDFYKAVAGTTPDDNSPQKEKLDQLTGYIQTINGYVDKVIGMTDEELDALNAPKMWRENEALVNPLRTKLYSLQYRDSVQGYRSDETKIAIKKLVDRFQLNFGDVRIVDIMGMKLVKLANGSQAMITFFNFLKTLNSDDVQTNNRVKVVHGSRSSSLIGLAQTGAMLIPTGLLNSRGITPMSGELYAGAGKYGVNRDTISGNLLSRFKSSWSNYAEYQANKSSDPITEYINDRAKYTTIDNQTYSIQDIAKVLESTVYNLNQRPDYSTFAGTILSRIVFNLNAFQYQRLPYQIKQLRQLEPAAFEPLRVKLLDDLESELGMLETLKEKGQIQFFDEKLKMTYLVVKSTVKNSIKAINSPLIPLTDEEKSMIEKSFPVVFASNFEWETNYMSEEYNHAGPLALGDGISHIIVPNDKVGFMTEWVNKHVIRESVPQVLSLEEFYNQYPEAKG